MVQLSYCCHVGKLDYDDPIWVPIPVQHFVGSHTGEITTAKALDYWNYLAQVFLEFFGVHDGMLADPIGYHCDLLARRIARKQIAVRDAKVRGEIRAFSGCVADSRPGRTSGALPNRLISGIRSPAETLK
jgi:hypothetical protein